MPVDLAPLWLSLQVAGLATALMLPFGLLAAWWLGQGRGFPGKSLIETLFTLPLVLPPTVVGYALLLLFGQGTAVGRWLNETAHVRLLFTWQGASVAAAVMAFPLFVRTASAAFAAVDRELLEAGRTLGASEFDLWRQVTIPLAYRGLLAALALGFARALGEFGATLMVAGSIPGRTQTLPLALYASVQAGHDPDALVYTLLLTLLAFGLLGTLGAWQTQITRSRGDR